MGVFLKYFERLSYLLSQGVLRADVAVMYPVTPVQAGMDGDVATKTAFTCGTELYNQGHDFIFMDHQSLARLEVKGDSMHASDQSFRVLILPAMKAVRWTTIQKALEFYRSGGIVMAVGSLPQASDRAGSNDLDLDKAVKEIFGISASEMAIGGKAGKQRSPAGGQGLWVRDARQLANEIGLLLPADVEAGEPVKAMHRRIGFRDVYMVMGARKNSWCTFRSKGKVELWDPWSGKTVSLYESMETPEGTRVKIPLDRAEAQVIVFSPADNKVEITENQLDEIDSVTWDHGQAHVSGYSISPGAKSVRVKVNNAVQMLSAVAGPNPPPIRLDGDWEFELKPTMDNRWGDFRLPVAENVIGAEAGIFKYAEESPDQAGWEQPGFDDAKWRRVTYGFGQKLWKLGPLPAGFDPSDLDKELSILRRIDRSKPVLLNGKAYYWLPYDFSWRMGVEGDPGHQGYHGLKEEVTDEFICLGKPTRGLNETVYAKEDGGSRYYLWTSAFAEETTRAEIDAGGLVPAGAYLNGEKIANSKAPVKLNKGANPLLLRYESAGRGHYVLKRAGFAANAGRIPLSMKWWTMGGRIAFDISGSEKTPAGLYRFIAPPGLKSMFIRAHGQIQVWVNGKASQVKVARVGDSSGFSIDLGKSIPENAHVAIRIEPSRGEVGGSALPEPILIRCERGIAKTGDWSRDSVLECYSGGAWYRRTVLLSKTESQSRVLVDLGDVVATAQVYVNGSSAGILVAPPWKLDISKWAKEGNNRIEILVYNTLANHYRIIPSNYRGNSIRSGLLGPVILHFSTKVVLN